MCENRDVHFIDFTLFQIYSKGYAFLKCTKILLSLKYGVSIIYHSSTKSHKRFWLHTDAGVKIVWSLF